jgi:vacuolar protein sorting-associated protein 72
MMSAVASRERRSTAGKRMSSLVGKAQDEDDTFWGHETWAEDDSGNESFAESDVGSEERVDQFDSDFDESESDHDAEDEAAGAEEETRLRVEERSEKRQHKFDVAKAGRALMQKKKGKGKTRATRAMGDGINAGLVLNFPAAGAAPPLRAATIVPPIAPALALTLVAPPGSIAPTANRSLRQHTSRSTTGKRSLRAATVTKSQQAESTRKATVPTTSVPAKKKQRRFTQEELLLEAATVTEPENERWLLARKRIQQSENDSQKGSQEEKRGKVICKFRSRRGCLNSITFPDMDYVPDILSRKHVAPKKPKVPTECVITGKKARYRDPKTMLGYHDIEAFKELRRRFNKGEPLDQRVKKKPQTDVPMLQAEQTSIATSETTSAKQDSSKQEVKSVASAAICTSTTKPTTPVAIKSDVPLGARQMDSTQEPSSSKPAPNDSGTTAASTTTAGMPKVAEQVASSDAKRKLSPRRRKPSAKMAAAAETELVLPTKAPISSDILNMTATAQQNSAKSLDNASTVKVAEMPSSTNDYTHASESTESMISNALAMYNKMKHEND